MAHIDDLMDATSTKFHLAMLAAKRAREINEYYQQLGEGTGRLIAPLVNTESSKPLSIALEEIAQGKVIEAEPVEVVADDPLAFIGAEGAIDTYDTPEVPQPLAAVPDPVEVDEDADDDNGE